MLGSESILGSTETIEVRDEDGKSILYGTEKMGDSYYVASWMFHCVRSVQLLIFFFVCVCCRVKDSCCQGYSKLPMQPYNPELISVRLK